jgi:hypothetical protein
MAEKDKCAHGPCSCRAAANSKYCSEYCKDAEDAGVIEIACGCTHPNCK